MNITAKTKINLIIGDPVEHSLSPQMHNSAYKTLGLEGDFAYLAARVMPEKLRDAVLGIRALNIHGITVTHPHKLTVMKHLDKIDEIAGKIGAVNTIINNNGILTGINTDWIGVVMTLGKVTDLNNKHVALIGAGGAARAALYGVLQKGAKATIFNRTTEHAKTLAKEFGCNSGSFAELKKVKDMDIIINVTSAGFENNLSLLPKDCFSSHHVVLDAIYSPYETKFLHSAKNQGATIIHGTEWLLYQGLAQFKIFTGNDAPEDVMRKAIMDSI